VLVLFIVVAAWAVGGDDGKPRGARQNLLSNGHAHDGLRFR